MFVTLCQLWNTLKLIEYNTNLRIWLSCCFSMQSKEICCCCIDAIECENCCRVMKSMNTCGGVSGQQTVPLPFLHCTRMLYFSHSPAPVRNKKTVGARQPKYKQRMMGEEFGTQLGGREGRNQCSFFPWPDCGSKLRELPPGVSRVRKSFINITKNTVFCKVMPYHLVWFGFAEFLSICRVSWKWNPLLLMSVRSTMWRGWLRHRATSRRSRVRFLRIFHWFNPSGHNTFVGSAQPLTEINTRDNFWERGGGVLKAANA